MRGSKIVRRSRVSYSFSYELPPGPDGRRRRRTVTVRGCLRDAERRRAEILQQLSGGDGPCAAARS
jgi:hypothetical protein